MQLAFSIALAYLRGRVRQTATSTLGVMMGVGFFIGIASMMQGFQHYFVEQLVDVSPHITIRDEFREPPLQPAAKANPDAVVEVRGLKPEEERRGIRGARQLIRQLEHYPGIRLVPSLKGQAFVSYGGREEAATLVGTDPAKERLVSKLEHDMVSGSLNALQTHSNGIILGVGFMKKLGLHMGSKITVTSPTGVIMKMKVVGVFNTGIVTLDDFYGYIRLKKAQVLQDKTDIINEIRIHVADVDKAEMIAADIERIARYRTESWQEANRNFLGIFVIQNGVMYSTVSAILIVAGFGIFNIISTIINEKQRDIAILKSIGFSERDLRRIFLIQGVIIGAAGSIIGWGLGYGLIVFLESLDIAIDGIVRSQGFVMYKSVSHYAISGILALLSSSVAAYLPARRAAHMNPVEIIRGAA